MSSKATEIAKNLPALEHPDGSPIRALVVDDEEMLKELVSMALKMIGWEVQSAGDGPSALNIARDWRPDVLVLDIMMPGFDGFLLCRRFKAQMTAPVIFLTSLTEKEYLYQGFSLGGDDFLTKPWDLKELEMRIRTRISQCSNRSLKGEQLEFPPLTIDAGTRQASIGNVCVPLTAYEFDILLLLARSPGHVFSPDSIYREIWKLPDLDNTQTVKVHVARMRHKMEAACPGHSFIGTVWKQGYRFLPENS